MTPTWFGTSRIINDGGLRRVVTEVVAVPVTPDRAVPIAVCAAADQRVGT